MFWLLKRKIITLLIAYTYQRAGKWLKCLQYCMSTDKSEIFTNNIVIILKETGKFGELGSPASSYFKCLVLEGGIVFYIQSRLFHLYQGGQFWIDWENQSTQRKTSTLMNFKMNLLIPVISLSLMGLESWIKYWNHEGYLHIIKKSRRFWV